mgnify:CR=1 FL=1
MDSMILLVAMIAVFYFLIIRPENKRKKQAENMRNSLKKGERITTIGGLVGRIVQVNVIKYILKEEILDPDQESIKESQKTLMAEGDKE